MRCSISLAALLVAATAVCNMAAAQMPDYKNVGRTPTPREIHAWDISILPDGKGLPPGSGTPKRGAVIFAQNCAYCHGPTGDNGPGPHLSRDAKVVPDATIIWDVIRRAMPLDRAGSLSTDDVYALTAFILHRYGIIGSNAVLDAKNLPKVKMPNRNGFYPPTNTGWEPWLTRPYGVYQ